MHLKKQNGRILPFPAMEVFVKASIPAAVLLLCVTFCSGVSQSEAQEASQPVEYKAGQVWKYKTAPGAENSTVIILKVEASGKKGNVVHIRIDNMPFQNCGGFHLPGTLDHLAVSEKALRKSTTELVRTDVNLPESYLDAYKQWQKARQKPVVNRPLAEVALPQPTPMICNWRETT